MCYYYKAFFTWLLLRISPLVPYILYKSTPQHTYVGLSKNRKSVRACVRLKKRPVLLFKNTITVMPLLSKTIRSSTSPLKFPFSCWPSFGNTSTKMHKRIFTVMPSLKPSSKSDVLLFALRKLPVFDSIPSHSTTYKFSELLVHRNRQNTRLNT